MNGFGLFEYHNTLALHVSFLYVQKISKLSFYSRNHSQREMSFSSSGLLISECIIDGNITIFTCIFVKIDYHRLGLFMPMHILKDTALESTRLTSPQNSQD